MQVCNAVIKYYLSNQLNKFPLYEETCINFTQHLKNQKRSNLYFNLNDNLVSISVYWVGQLPTVLPPFNRGKNLAVSLTQRY